MTCPADPEGIPAPSQGNTSALLLTHCKDNSSDVSLIGVQVGLQTSIHGCADSREEVERVGSFRFRPTENLSLLHFGGTVPRSMRRVRKWNGGV